MLILAMESSAKAASVAVTENGKLLGQYFQDNGLTHSKTLLLMTESMLSNLGISPAEIALVAVACGPGSFTGIRIGVSAAKGFAWGSGIPICGVSTLEAMAFQAQERDRVVCAVMDARREQVYNALFESRDNKPLRLCDDRAVSLEELSADLKDSAKSYILVGDGAELTFERLNKNCKSTVENITLAPGIMRAQSAYGVALAAAFAVPIPAIELEPSYLRPSQAERELGERAKT